MTVLRLIAPSDLPPASFAIDPETLAAAAQIVDDVRREGDAALARHARRLGDLDGDRPLILGRPALDEALAGMDDGTRALLERTAARIQRFARAQRDCLSELETEVEGGVAGHRLLPVARVGCYVPGGRHPLPSSLLMTAIPARVAGVEEIWVATPRPGPVTLAAAAVAGVDAVLTVGGAQAIAALAYGTESVSASDLIVGPGNRWVTAAKKLVYGDVGIDMLAGPSELVVLADESAEARIVAADLIAQAEHDVDARPILVTPSASLAAEVDAELERQLVDLPTAPTARAAFSRSFTVLVADLAEGAEVCNRLAPEHLEVMVTEVDQVVPRLRSHGALFEGRGAAEVFGDYGVGPNHVLPTGGTARFTGGLSVFTFLRPVTWLRLDAPGSAIEDAAALARLEGLEGHARAAVVRSGSDPRRTT